MTCDTGARRQPVGQHRHEQRLDVLGDDDDLARGPVLGDLAQVTQLLTPGVDGAVSGHDQADHDETDDGEHDNWSNEVTHTPMMP